MTKEEFIKKTTELAAEFWLDNGGTKDYKKDFTKLVNQYESSKIDLDNEDTRVPFKATKEGKLYIETSDFFKLKSVRNTINKLIESSIYKNINKQSKEEKYKELSKNEITAEHIQKFLSDRLYNTVKETIDTEINRYCNPHAGGNDLPIGVFKIDFAKENSFINIKNNNNLSDLQKMDVAEALDIEMKKYKDKLLLNIETLIRIEKDSINGNKPSLLTHINMGRLLAFDDVKKMINDYKK